MPEAEKLKVVPPAWAKLHRAGQRRLLIAERAQLKLLRAALEAGTERLRITLLRSPSRRAALLTIRATQQHLQQLVAGAVLRGKAMARDAARSQIEAELEQVERELTDLGHAIEPLLPASSDKVDDETAAAAVSSSFAAAWASALLATVIRWERQGGDGDALQRDTAQSVARLDYRLRRIGATEVSRSFSAEIDDGLDDIADQHEDTHWIVALFKRWDATLDRRTCRFCERMDGTVVLVGTAFPEAQLPGEVHPLCRCTVGTVFLPWKLTKTTEVPRGDGGVAKDEAA